MPPTVLRVHSSFDTMDRLQRDRPAGPNLEGDAIESMDVGLDLPAVEEDVLGGGLELPANAACGDDLWNALVGSTDRQTSQDNVGVLAVNPIVESPGVAGSVEHNEENIRTEAVQEQLNLATTFPGSLSLTRRPAIEVDVTSPQAPPHLREEQGPVVAVPADGLCLYYCAVACNDLARWAATHCRQSGLAMDLTERAYDTAQAWIYRTRVIEAARQDGDIAMADRLSSPGLLGFPDQDALPYLAKALGGQIVLQSMHVQAVYGEGPLQAHLLFCISVDGAGKSSGHFAVLQSWVPLSAREKRQRVHEDGTFTRNDSSSVGLHDPGNRPAPAIEDAASTKDHELRLSTISSVPQENLNPSLRADAHGDRVADADQRPRHDFTCVPDEGNTAAFLNLLGNAAGGFGERPNEVDLAIDMNTHILA